ncbi:MAG: histidine phosphatase family protein [Spirochaetaceae bacterium]|nr:histidine phosphatase family protein [Spirochaetaceae bacterium]
MSRLLFIRHAESEANAARILASRLPFPLTGEGRADAGRIARELRDLVSLDRIISSPLRRAQETADAFAKGYRLPVEYDTRIAEQELGRFSGMSYDLVPKEPTYEGNPLARWNWVPDGGGESYAMVADRVVDFLSSLEGADEKSAILVVTHAVVFRLLRAALEDTLPVYPEAFPNNGEIWDVDYRGLGNRHHIRSIFLGESRKFVHNP